MSEPTSFLRLVIRLPWLGAHIGLGLMIAAVRRLQYGDEWFLHSQGRVSIHNWMKRLCRILSLNVIVKGLIPNKTGLIVANHISWLDIIALNSVVVLPTTFISKSDVRGWPLIGRLVAASGTLFIRRGSISALNKAINGMTSRLQKGQSVTLFPEGTTTAGRDVLKFKGALFQSAINAGVEIQPVHLHFFQKDGRFDELAPYIDDDTFFDHLARVLSRNETCIAINFLPSLTSTQGNRAELAQLSYQMIAECSAVEYEKTA